MVLDLVLYFRMRLAFLFLDRLVKLNPFVPVKLYSLEPIRRVIL